MAVRAFVILALLSLPAQSVSANVVKATDTDAFVSLAKRTLTLMKDTNDLAGSNIGTSPAIVHCLFDLHRNLARVSERFFPVVSLARLSAVMADSRDEQSVNSTLSNTAGEFLRTLEMDRRGINNIAASVDFCPQNNSVVASTTQKILRIYSDAASLAGSIIKKIGASSPPQ